MSENRFPCGAAPSANGCGREGPRETACIETNRILDSCRDRDCYENARVYLTDMGQELIENTGQVRVKECCIAWTYIGIDPVQFNRGFYAITIRFFVKLICEACVRGGRGQEFDGIAVLEKQVVLFPCHRQDFPFLTYSHITCHHLSVVCRLSFLRQRSKALRSFSHASIHLKRRRYLLFFVSVITPY